ncbi:MAG: 50S ribosomal protein L31e [Candidatus Micrarchaeia archaeon]|jgi:large subunit ribosomal protein L31e
MAENASVAPAAKAEAKQVPQPAAQVAAAKPAAEKKAEPAKAQGPAAEAVKKEEAPREVKKREITLERVYNVPLVEAYKKTHYKRADFAMNLLREFLSRHMDVPVAKVSISPILNEFIRARGSRHPEKIVKVRATKDKEGTVLAEPSE